VEFFIYFDRHFLLGLCVAGSSFAAPGDEADPCPRLLAGVGLGVDNTFQGHIDKTQQTPLSEFPPAVQQQVAKIVAVTDANGWEHATMVLQVGAVFLVAKSSRAGVVTSKDTAKVGSVDQLPMVLSLVQQWEKLPAAQREKPVTLFHFHTHPH